MKLIHVVGMISAMLGMMILLLAQAIARPFLPKDDPLM